eukprot:gnl/MRDRNA2_/MRDRNA2_20504_c0_seq1.p1 gnl/MRDRNA2_/MRDRNA2_20504_c0~~gnl/MRDRNA2_/MRDRNA2_20504_c0_seq1.p1  ORF type:complete len:1049 (-),score=127.49 gnl/MRDRNA2_/MRDRNA2_20504_c0_seq1:99-2807(-)
MAELGALDAISLLTRGLLLSLAKLFAVVCLCSGFIVVMEWIGHDNYVQEQKLGPDPNFASGECSNFDDMNGNIACLPFTTTIYWIFTTISTVGYGDFGPKTNLCFMWCILLIIVGVTFFSVESGVIVDVMALAKSGFGDYRKHSNEAHIVLTGNGVRQADTVVLSAFFHNLFHRACIESGHVWPQVVLLGEIEDTDPINEFLDQDLTSDVRRHVTFINGSPLKKQGLQRALAHSARMIYILPHLACEDMDDEDEFNIQIALSVKSQTDTPFRLALMRPSSLKLAVTCGVRRARCLTLNLMKTALCAQTARVSGWSTLMTLLMTNNHCLGDLNKFVRGNGISSSFIGGLDQTFWGFALCKAAAGLTFVELSRSVYGMHGVLPMAAALDGTIHIFPSEVQLDEGTVVFCVGNADPHALDEDGEFVDKKVDWKVLFVQSRVKATSGANPSGAKPSGANPAASAADALKDIMSFGPGDDRTPDHELEAMKQKAFQMKRNSSQYGILIVTCDGKIWQQVHAFINNFSATKDGGETLGLVLLLPSAPPKKLTDAVDSSNPNSNLCFVVGDFRDSELLTELGVGTCAVVVAQSCAPPCRDPEVDAPSFFLMKTIAKGVQLSENTAMLLELSSGTTGIHMLPDVEELHGHKPGSRVKEWRASLEVPTPQEIPGMPPPATGGPAYAAPAPGGAQPVSPAMLQGEDPPPPSQGETAKNEYWELEDDKEFVLEPDSMEDVLYHWVASGNAFIPHAIVGMLAKTFYCTGLLEIVQGLTVGSANHAYGPESIVVPKQLVNCTYSHVVESLLSTTIGPCPALPLGILRTKNIPQVIAHPVKNELTQDGDLLIILANAEWVRWAKGQGIYAVAGKPRGLKAGNKTSEAYSRAMGKSSQPVVPPPSGGSTFGYTKSIG